MGERNIENMEALLRSSGMSVTEKRIRILALFFHNPGSALKHADIEQQLGQLDRVTIYRTLHTFLEKGLIHTVPNSDGTSMYALCRSNDCHEGHHHDDHVHFLCKTCGATLCLEHVVIPNVNLPAGYAAAQTEMVISGTCATCNDSGRIPPTKPKHLHHTHL